MLHEDAIAQPVHRTKTSFQRRLFRAVLLLFLTGVTITVVPVLLMRWWHPFTSAFMVRSAVQALIEGDRRYDTQYTWVDMRRISPNAAIAVIASEDQQFPFHYGFDLNSIRKAMETNRQRAGQNTGQSAGKHKRLRGASTISQQVAKNLFLWSGRSYFRKALEAWITVLIETFWPKQRILEVYLNIVELGKGVYGVEAASRKYFHKPASRLTASDAAMLAAVLPNPRRFRVERPSGYVYTRRDWIMGQMRRLGGASYLRAVTAADGS